MEDWRIGGFGLYLHWPFCESKCPYCDFNSHVAAQIDTDRWRRAYLNEIERLGNQTRGRVLQSVYFGGGTPSLMAPELVAAVLDKVRATWPMANSVEITLEANPGSIEAGRFAAYRQSGVNRVSMGMQAMNDADLQRLGRRHTAAEARKAFEIARQIFDRVSFDLIYARQDQSLEAWRNELTAALSLAADHLSLYQLTIESGTAFADRLARGGLRGLPDEDLSVDLFDATQDICDAAGMPAYEVSNHARPEAGSRHNLIYWRGGDYLGIGPGAHGRLTLDGTRWATEAPRAPGAWLTQVERTGAGELPRSRLSAMDHAEEYLLMSLRLSEGTSLARLESLCGTPLPLQKLSPLIELGLLRDPDGRLVTTMKGRLVLNSLLAEIAAALL
ncbi:radical SAM family heme chaperone HemW [Paracoccaceae bacterium]